MNRLLLAPIVVVMSTAYAYPVENPREALLKRFKSASEYSECIERKMLAIQKHMNNAGTDDEKLEAFTQRFLKAQKENTIRNFLTTELWFYDSRGKVYFDTDKFSWFQALIEVEELKELIKEYELVIEHLVQLSKDYKQ